VGLGLSTVYGIIEQHGGTVTAQSAPGQGSEFVIELPTGANPAQPSPNRPPAHPDGQI
jgi:signal transduction histidine kinase